MEAAATEMEAEVLKALAKLNTILEPAGLQEEAELPAQMLAEFVMDSRKKDKLLCSQLQVVDFLQSFMVNEDTAQDLASEDASRKMATEAKEQWKELKATYQEHVEAITSGLKQALPMMEEARLKQVQLQEALEQLQAKKQVAVEKQRAAQQQWQLQQEKHVQHVAEIRARQKETQQDVERLDQELGSLMSRAEQERDKLHRHQTFLQLLYNLQDKMLPEAEAERQPPQKLSVHRDISEDKPQELTWPKEQNHGVSRGGDGVTLSGE
ncbi:outer kinetochore KNL1 complex subunit ZWINT [Tenrec ecaudatus]|uniref:outer kinetochore KNL1 complex subunit ZWINT n=1 Tax=Tenrec ecaudatus TaxID=94439 RepID=UPI003F59D0B7